MKRVFAFIISLVMLLSLCACGANSNSVAYANQTEFLKDMAKGIQKRLEDNTDSSSLTIEELAAFYEKLVGYELNYIEKYTDQTFADSTFNELAHEYINACKMQLFGAQSYRNSGLYEALWSGGRTIRSAIIVEFYERYDLPITEDEVSSYKSSSSSSASASLSMDGNLDLSTGLTFYDEKMVTCETIKISSDSNQILYEDENISITLKSLEIKSGSYYINLTIINNKSEDKISCFCANGYLDDYKISLYSPWGYEWVAQGKRANTYSRVESKDVEESGTSKPKVVYTSLYIISNNGETGQYIAKIPLEINWSLFN